MRHLCRLTAVILFPALSGCGGSESVESNTYLSQCQRAQDLACEKGWSCNSFFMKSQYNSVDHCKSELDQARRQLMGKLSGSQLTSCAQACDVMRSDVEAVSCDKFDDATFKTYKCGS
jgi:hypothetical protein